jgi:hypothetical protein
MDAQRPAADDRRQGRRCRPGDVTVFEAIDKQLGLQLREQKHPMPVIVIDHVADVGQVDNLRRIVNPPFGLTRISHRTTVPPHC